MTILVTGGAGYIGSHAVKRLVEAGRSVVVVDHLGRGHRTAVHPKAAFHDLDTRDTPALVDVMRQHEVSAVMHFAAYTAVGESVENPLLYYQNNVAGSLGLLQAMREAGVRRMVFSSTAAVYGETTTLPLVESLPTQPINPYGWSKWMVERILADELASDPDFAYAALRYFNVAGCAADGSLGEDHDPETHLIPLVIFAALGLRDSIRVFGRDYPTPDGTCLRDYVHVEDLCEAHLLALDALESGDARVYNLGIGRPYSVQEVIESVKRVSGREINVVDGERRAGDPPELWADATSIREELGWSPRYTELDGIVETAWKWFEHRGATA